MASIAIINNSKNLIFAAEVANDTGAEFREDGQSIIISDSPELTIPHYTFSHAFDPDGKRASDGTNRLDSAWRSLLLNKCGYLKYFGDDEIVLADDDPHAKPARPQFLLRFRNQAERTAAEQWSDRAGFESLTEYILEAVGAYNEYWQQRSGQKGETTMVVQNWQDVFGDGMTAAEVLSAARQHRSKAPSGRAEMDDEWCVAQYFEDQYEEMANDPANRDAGYDEDGLGWPECRRLARQVLSDITERSK